MTIEARFHIPVVATRALREKQIQQNYRPTKWTFRMKPFLVIAV